MNTPNMNTNLNNRRFNFYNYNMSNQHQQQLMQNYYYQQQNLQMQNQYHQQQLQNQYYQQQIQNQYHQQQLQNQYYQQQMQNQYYQQQMQNNFRQQHLVQLQNQYKMGQNLIDQNKNECNEKKDILKIEKSKKSNNDVKNDYNEKKGELKLEISEEEYSKSNDDIKNKYEKCTNNNCTNPLSYHLIKKIFYIDSKNKLFCRSCFKPGMKGMHGSLCCEDSSNSTSQLCFLGATYGYAGGKPLRCTIHKLNNMINVNVSLCQFINPNKKRCKKKAYYGFSRRERCDDHKIEGMKKIDFRKNKTKK